MSFFERYAAAAEHIDGWFQFDAALLFSLCAELVAEETSRGNVLEIGVHEGLSAIVVAGLRGAGKRMVAVDLFEELQDLNVSHSGSGKRDTFLANMAQFHEPGDWLQVIARRSSEIAAEELGDGFTFCHIDGGHSAEEADMDLELCSKITSPGGLIALDDYFNEEFPEVLEGAVEYYLGHRDDLAPIAIGYNKVLFRKRPFTINVVSRLEQTLPEMRHKIVRMWATDPMLMQGQLKRYVDLASSQPDHIAVKRDASYRIGLTLDAAAYRAPCGSMLDIAVGAVNQGLHPTPHGKRVFGITYHLQSSEGETLAHDNDRAWVLEPLASGAGARFDVPVKVPAEPGRYRLEFDAVWEGVMWLAEAGSPTVIAELEAY